MKFPHPFLFSRTIHVSFSESLIWWSGQAEAHCAVAELSCVYGIFTLKKDHQLKERDPIICRTRTFIFLCAYRHFSS